MADKNGPIVPTNAWKHGLAACYADAMREFGAGSQNLRYSTDGSIYLDVDAAPEELEAVGLTVLSTQYLADKGWHVVNEAGMEYAATNHPSEGRANPQATGGTTLTPEEQARRKKAQELKAKLEAIREQQRQNRPEEGSDSDE